MGIMKRISRAPVFLLFALAAAPTCFADELIRFKSGYEMMVVSHREERGMVIVQLDGGGEVGFPKDLIENLEGGKATTRTGGSPLWNKVPSRVHVQKFVARESQYPSRFLAKGVATSEGATVGYSRPGEPARRFSGGPVGPVAANGRIGFDVRDRNRVGGSKPAGDISPEQARQKSKVRSLEVDMPATAGGD